MGKGKKNKKASKRAPLPLQQIPAIIYRVPEDRTRPDRLPLLIPPDTFEIISNVMLQTLPPYRNVFLSMNEYRIRDINPLHKETRESPTHMIIFCVRVVVSNQFFPIGIVQFDYRREQVDKLVSVWKVFLYDLSILRLVVIGSISPPTMIFHKILSELTKIPKMEDFTGPIVYSVWPYKEIVHLYDYYQLLHETQEALYERNEIYFMARPPSDETSCSLQLWKASWTDILIVLTSNDIKCYYTSDDPDAALLAIFSICFLNIYQQARESGVVETDTKVSTDRLMDLLCCFTKFFYDFDKSFMDPYDLQKFYDSNEELRILLATAMFKKVFVSDSKKTPPKVLKINCNKSTSGNYVVISKASVLSPQNSSAEPSNSSEVGQKDTLLDFEHSSVDRLVRDTNENSPFDIFMRKIAYDDYDLFLRTSSKDSSATQNPETSETKFSSKSDGQKSAEIASSEPNEPGPFGKVLCTSPRSDKDHSYFKTNRTEDASSSKTASIIYNVVKNYFGNAIEEHKKSLQESNATAVIEDKSDKPVHVSEVGSSAHSVRNNSDNLLKITLELPTNSNNQSGTNSDIHSSSFSQTLFEQYREDNQLNVSTRNMTDKLGEVLDRPSRSFRSCKKNQRLDQENKKVGNLKEFKIDLTLQGPRSKKIKAKRLNSREKAHKLVANLPVILCDNNSPSLYFNNVESLDDGDISKSNDLNVVSVCLEKSDERVEFLNKVVSHNTGLNILENSKTDNNNSPDKKVHKGSVVKKADENLRCQFLPTDLRKTVQMEGEIIATKTFAKIASEKQEIDILAKENTDDDGLSSKINCLSRDISISELSNAHNKNSIGNGSEKTNKFSDKMVSLSESGMNKLDPNSNLHCENMDEMSQNLRENESFLPDNLTKSILNSAAKDFSNIFVSYTEALGVSQSSRSNQPEDLKDLQSQSICKEKVLSMNKVPDEEENMDIQISDSGSTDSLTELWTSVEVDPSSTKIPCKHTISKIPCMSPKVTTKLNSEFFTLNYLQQFRDPENNFEMLNSRNDIITQDLFHHTKVKKSAGLNQPTLESDANQNLSNFRETVEQFFGDANGNDLNAASQKSILNEPVAVLQNDTTVSPPLSFSDSLEDDTEECFTDLVENTDLYRNINRMFISTVKCLNSTDKNVMEPNLPELDNSVPIIDAESMPDLEELFAESGIKGNSVNNNSPLGTAFKTKVAQHSDIMPCCKGPSTSSYQHIPTNETNNIIFLPHYTRFKKSPKSKQRNSESTSSSSSLIPVSPNKSFRNDKLNITIVPNPDVTEDDSTGKADWSLNKLNNICCGNSNGSTSYHKSLNSDDSGKETKIKKPSNLKQNNSCIDDTPSSIFGVSPKNPKIQFRNNYNSFADNHNVAVVPDLVSDPSIDCERVNDFEEYCRFVNESHFIDDPTGFAIQDAHQPERCYKYDIEYKEFKNSSNNQKSNVAVVADDNQNYNDAEVPDVDPDTLNDSFRVKDFEENRQSVKNELFIYESDNFVIEDEYQPENPNQYVKHQESESLPSSTNNKKLKCNVVTIDGSNNADIHYDCRPKESVDAMDFNACDNFSGESNRKESSLIANDNSNNVKIQDESGQEDSNDFIDYNTYKMSLDCDNQYSKFDAIYKDRKAYEKLYNQIPEHFETVRVTTDWLCTFKGYIKLKEILIARKVREFHANLLTLEHIDFLIYVLKKARNNLHSAYEGGTYRLFDYRGALDVFKLGNGVYMVTKDDDNCDVNNMSL